MVEACVDASEKLAAIRVQDEEEEEEVDDMEEVEEVEEVEEEARPLLGQPDRVAPGEGLEDALKRARASAAAGACCRRPARGGSRAPGSCQCCDSHRG